MVDSDDERLTEELNVLPLLPKSERVTARMFIEAIAELHSPLNSTFSVAPP